FYLIIVCDLLEPAPVDHQILHEVHDVIQLGYVNAEVFYLPVLLRCRRLFPVRFQGSFPGIGFFRNRRQLFGRPDLDGRDLGTLRCGPDRFLPASLEIVRWIVPSNFPSSISPFDGCIDRIIPRASRFWIAIRARTSFIMQSGETTIVIAYSVPASCVEDSSRGSSSGMTASISGGQCSLFFSGPPASCCCSQACNACTCFSGFLDDESPPASMSSSIS